MTVTTETVIDLEKKALKHFEQGNLQQALLLFEQLDPKKENPNISKHVFTCNQLLLRKYWRQGKPEFFLKAAQNTGKASLFQLPYAKLLNSGAVEKVASSQLGLQSTLATCLLLEDLKTAFLLLRKEPGQKEIAEAGLCLLKGDAEKALSILTSIPFSFPQRVLQGISYLIGEKTKEAKQLLQHLKPFASRFPVLHSAMGWDNTVEVDEQIISHYLFKASLKDLIEAEKKLLPHQKELHGWISLRIGDHLFYQEQSKPIRRNYTSAIAAWEKGALLKPELKIDVLKRLFIVSKEPEYHHRCGQAFKELYCYLHKKAPELAKEFLAQEDLTLNFPLQAKDVKTGSYWIVTPPPKELQYLWLILTYSETIYPYSQLLFMNQGITPEDLTSQPWSFWESLFNTFDPFYDKVDRYLECKQIISKLHLQSDALRQSLIKRLQINPLRKNEFLPLYVRECIKSLRISVLEQEIKTLLLLFPSDYDLLRLSILVSEPPHMWQKTALNMSLHMSKPLAAVFQLHLAVDLKIPLKNEMLQYMGQDEEADWRLFAILNTPELKFPKKEFMKLAAALTQEKMHFYFKNMFNHYGISPPLSLLKKWQKDASNLWEPFYHTALFYINQSKFDEAIENLIEAEHRINPSCPERIAIQQTLDCSVAPIEKEQFLQHFMEWMNQYHE